MIVPEREIFLIRDSVLRTIGIGKLIDERYLY